MISFLIIFIPIIVLGVIFVVESCWFGFWDGFWDLILGIVFGACVGLLLLGIISDFVATTAALEPVVLEEIEICAFQDNFSIGGSFFLGSGYVKNEQRYYFLRKNENGLKMESISVDNTYLNTSDKPRIEVCKNRFKSEFLRNNFIDPQKRFHKVYIPKGSIKYDFNVDLK